MKKQLALAITAALLSAPVFADDDHHAFDPRNTQARLGTMVNTDTGEMKVFAGYGANDLYDAGEGHTTNTILFGEYFTDTDNMRGRLAHFDSRFGGVYMDLYGTKYADSYTAGYMLPLTAANGTTKLFPSVNYSYVDIDTGKIAGKAANSDKNIDGTSSAAIENALRAAGAKDAHLASINFYALQPWNDTHYTVIQAMSGQAVDGIDDLNFVDVMWIQGMQAYVGDKNVNLYLEFRYHNIESDLPGFDRFRDEDYKVSIAVETRF